jgi:hypothetical protein
VGREHVHVVVAGGSTDAASAGAAEVLGVGLVPRRRALEPRWKDLSPSAVDVVRRVNTVLDVRVREDRHAEALRTLVPAVARAGRPDHALTVPEPFQDWARRRAERIESELTDGGYPVRGRLEELVPSFEGLPAHPRRADALDVLLTACLALAARAQVPGDSRRRGAVTGG